MLTMVRNLSTISSSDIFFLLCVVLLAGVVVGVLTWVVLTLEDTGGEIGTVAFLFLSKTGENGTVPLAVFGNVSDTSSSTGLVY